MSKSLDNYVGITEPPNEMFGKLMSISDELMWRYYELLSFRPEAEIAKLKRECAEGRNPRDAKVALAQEIVERFHSRAAAEHALAEFEARFRQGALPEDMPEVTLAASGGGLPIAQLAKQAGSSSPPPRRCGSSRSAGSRSTATSSPTRRSSCRRARPSSCRQASGNSRE